MSLLGGPADLARLFHTVRHLEPVQVTNRLRRRLAPLRELPEVTGPCVMRRHSAVPGVPPPADLAHDGGFTFLGRRLAFEGETRWEPAAAPKLWRYHLHYFRWLPTVPPATARQLVFDWVATQRDPRGTGWEPYPLSLRIREWIEWLVANPALPAEDKERILRSLDRQAAALAGQLEYHLLGNHLLENGITLAWAGLSLDGPRAGEWLASGIEVLERELPRQVLADGSHDERSPMYQALLAQALARLARVASDSRHPQAGRVRALAGPAAAALLRSLGQLVHPDGGYALLNDCALGGAPALVDLDADAHETAPPDGYWALPAAGYYGLRQDDAYLVFDAGPLGPDHQPGHGHADTLSFELSHRGRRLVTDTGVYTYEPGEARRHDRGTAAHNTIEVDARDQSELWAAFRCGRRARPIAAGADVAGGAVVVNGAYRGPGRSRAGVEHRREMRCDAAGIAVTDTVVSPGEHRATARLHLAPGLAVAPRDGGWEIRDDATALATLHSDELAWRESRSPYHPDFCVEHERVCLEAPFTWSGAATRRWQLSLL